MKYKPSSVIALALVLVACDPATGPITNFEECAAAGNPIMESYPRQCRAGDETFTEEIDTNDDYSDQIQVESHEAGDTVSSPLTVTGRARGTWYFEASFPVRLLDGNSNEIAIEPAQAQSDWMTEDFVPFSVTLTFATPATPTGTLVLEKDNPSGLPEHAASISIPVTF